MSRTPNRSPTRPLADLTGSQQNHRATPMMFTPTKGGDSLHNDADDLYDIKSITTTTTKSSHTMTIHNGEIVESSYHTSHETNGGNETKSNQEFYDEDVDDEHSHIEFEPEIPSSPFDYTLEIDTPATKSGGTSAQDPMSPSPVKVQQTLSEEEGNDSVIHHDIDDKEEGMSTIYHPANEHNSGADETEMTIDVGDLSTFSAVPNVDMTLFSGLRQSPAKGVNWSPGKQLQNSFNTPATTRTMSPRKGSPDDEATPRQAVSDSTDLLNFTGQSNIFIPPPASVRASRRSPSTRGAFPIRVSPNKSQAQLDRERAQPALRPLLTESKATVVPETPSRRTNLLDLDIEPLPTPRSVPTITPRELESLRSELTSQISALRATLSGKEAEVSALKRALTDAEIRCGTALEEVRNEKAKAENLEAEREGWSARQMEMEGLLRDVRQEVMIRTRDAEKSERKVDEMEKKVGEWEGKNRELEAQVETMRRRVAAAASAAAGGSEGVSEVTMKLMDVDAAVKDATERVARELHGLYKGKHETKVAALKKSYEARWEKRVKELEKNLKDAQDEVVTLKTERDATLSAPIPRPEDEAEKERLREEAEKLEADKQILQAKIQGLESELDATKEEGEFVRVELEKQRGENGELVAAVDAMLALQDEMTTNRRPPPSATPEPASPSSVTGLRTRSTTSTSMTGSGVARSSPHRPQSYIGMSSHTPSVASTSSTPKKTAGGRPMSFHSGLKLPQPTTSRIGGLPTSVSTNGLSGESRIGRGIGLKGPTRTTGLAEGIRMMGAGAGSR